MKVVMGVPDIHRIGGYERQALKLSQSLIAAGARVRILSNEPDLAKPAPRELWGLPIECLVPATTLGGASAYAHALRVLRDELATGERPVVHCHAASDFSFRLLAAAQSLGIPTLLKIATQNDITDISRAGYLARATHDGGPTIGAVLRRVDAIISLNEKITHELEQVLGIPDRIATRSNLVDPGRDLLADSGGPLAELRAKLHGQRLRYALMTNRLEKRKRTLAFVQAWSALPSALRDGWRLLIIGDGEEAPAIRAHLSRTSDGSVELLGERTDFVDLLAHADLFVFASEREGNPNGVLEALARGIPILASDIPGVGDCLSVSATGSVFSLGDPDALSHATPLIQAALESLARPVPVAGGPADIALVCEELFGPARVTAGYLRLYGNLLSRYAAPAPRALARKLWDFLPVLRAT